MRANSKLLSLFSRINLKREKIVNLTISPASIDEEDVDVEDVDVSMYVYRISQPDPAIDTSRVEEIPAKEPKFHAVPLKSVLKKRGTGSGPGTPQNTPTQENRPLTLRQELHASFKLVLSSLSPRANIESRFTVARVYPSMRKVFAKRNQFNLSK